MTPGRQLRLSFHRSPRSLSSTQRAGPAGRFTSQQRQTRINTLRKPILELNARSTKSSPSTKNTNEWTFPPPTLAADVPRPTFRAGLTVLGLIESPPWLAELVTKSAIGIIFATCLILFGAPAYRWWYHFRALRKMRKAFGAGKEPLLRLANLALLREEAKLGANGGASVDCCSDHHVGRKEQGSVDAIIKGERPGPHFVILGPKGTGKTTMLIDAMRKTNAEGVAMCEAHPDLDVFRLRLGEALQYKYFEDSLITAFKQRDPENTNPASSIERALNMLHDVAVQYAKKNKRPLVLVINNVQFFNNDEDGRNVILQFLQRAEAWGPSGILTFVFCSDDIWPVLYMHQNATSIQIISVDDVCEGQAVYALRRRRQIVGKAQELDKVYKEVVKTVGGRLSYLENIAQQEDIRAYTQELLRIEKAWLISRIGLLPERGDDMPETMQRSFNTWALLKRFVERLREHESVVEDHRALRPTSQEAKHAIVMPLLTYYQCCRIIKNPEHLEELDRANIIAMNINQDVRLHSLLVLRAATEIVENTHFQERFKVLQKNLSSPASA